jgi:hypothetical protein
MAPEKSLIDYADLAQSITTMHYGDPMTHHQD